MSNKSPDDHFPLHRHWAMDDVPIAVGFSGHGYKSSSVIGQMTAGIRPGEKGK